MLDLIRVKTNLGHTLTRKLPQPFSSKAIGTANPNTLNSNVPRLSDAMGRAGKSGVITFAHDGSSQDFTVFYWSSVMSRWVLLGANSAEYSKTVDQYAAASFTVPEDAPIFIMAGTSACTNCWMGGAVRHEANPNPDL